jgi:hypothetical protein
MEITVFWDVTACSLGERVTNVSGITFVTSYQSTRRHVPEESSADIHRRLNPKSRITLLYQFYITKAKIETKLLKERNS